MNFQKCNKAVAAMQGADKAEITQGSDGEIKERKVTDKRRTGNRYG